MTTSPSPAERAARGALAVTIVLAAAKVGVFVATGSLAALSQGLDSAIDIAALALVLVAVRLAAKPADRTHHYGHGKAENLVAFGQTIALGAIIAAVVYQAIVRLAGRPADVAAPSYALALFSVSAVIDIARVAILMRTARREHSEALRAGAMNIGADIGTALITVLSLAFVRGGVEQADAVGALIVAAVVAVAAFRLGRRSVDVLMDRAPGGPLEAITAAAASAPGVTEARRVRVRGDDKQLFADVTVAAGRTASLERAHDIAEGVENEIAKVAPGTDVIVHVEPASETTGFVERVQAAASRADGVHEVHNVSVHAFDDAGRNKLHVTLHAKVAAAVSIEEAHRLSDRVEAAVADELGRDVRVDTHLEPLVGTELGRDVTDQRADIVRTVKDVALEEPDVIDCHEVIVTAVGDHLSIVAHVRGRGSTPLAKIHDASDRIEKAVHARCPDVGSVVIHFEPA